MLSIHAIAASSLKTPELSLEQAEAHQLAEAMAEVAKHYPAQVDPKVLAWVNLSFAVIVCYGPRMYLIAERKKEERARNARSKETVQLAPVGQMDTAPQTEPTAVPKPPPGASFAGFPS